MRIPTGFAIAALTAGAASAQVLDTSTARGQLFGTGKLQTQVSGSLSEKERGTVKALIPLLEQQFRQPVKYYSSIAYSPDQGLVSDALQGAFNFHSPDAADAAALAACNAARIAGTTPCQLAGRVVPDKYQPRMFTLSSDATDAFNATYRRQRGAKALAISATTGAWGLGTSDGAATANCNANASGAADCRVVIRD